ncbi:E3 ubiquitin-protein ligase TRIM31-like [Castor canadensis]|uniref:E3 ubiquitin-protein ligase TRIM31-like n=1 Tax=Castor canadensis TaxID=51338 RepID=A0AC58NGV3_CASCN
MASQLLASTLQKELVCSICKDILKEPVTIDCGHNFCLTCISQIGEAPDGTLKCPLCQNSVRRTTFRHNWLLASLVEKIQAVDPPEIQPEVEERKCQRHGESFHYFCEHDGEFLCVVCRESKDHKFHSSSLIEEAAQNYQGQIQSHVQVLLQKEKEIMQEKIGGEQKIDVFTVRKIVPEAEASLLMLLESLITLMLWKRPSDEEKWHRAGPCAQVEFERRRILMEFKHLRQELEEEENFLLSRLCWLGHEVAKGRKFYTTSTEVQLNSLRKLIDSLKATQQMPLRQMLRDVKALLCRSKGFRFLNPTPVPVELEKKLSESKSSHASITDSLKKFKALLWARSRASYIEVPRDRTRPEDAGGTEDLRAALTPVTLDATSAHPDLTLSKDLKTVTLDHVPRGDCSEPTEPERFYPFCCLLGLPGLSSGRQAWEAELQGPLGGACVVGVALELVPRRGYLPLEPLSGFWALRISGSTCHALTERGTREKLLLCPRKVGVHVDHDCGKVVFYDATTSNHIYTFLASFPGQIFPFFRLLLPGTQITLSP